MSLKSPPFFTGMGIYECLSDLTMAQRTVQ
ncbi:heat-shock protein [Superficieibacter electus]|uniref:Heat-shock protein n=1 Tax=Superficieibacter electus TaxID=2022662 RepID=A0A2P5GWL7_9ENTR|nr:heat-shock protein [Superficieibacter electus]POP50966.1 heat-shock protein [Superficieibacter electus]